MIVEVVAVGTELLLGQIVNTNASEIGARLADAGVDHFHQGVVGDNIDRISEAVSFAAARADAVIVTGGIGPTPDDLTREALCAAAGVEMAFSDEHAAEMREYWEARGRSMPESNLRQARYPQGAELIPNPKGSAPAVKMSIGGAWVFAIPGVPAEMIHLMDTEVVPFLVSQAGGEGGVVASRVLRTWGESESRIGEILGDLYDAHTNPTIAFLASAGEIKVRITAKAGDAAAARDLIDPLETEVRRRLGGRVYGADDDTVEALLLDRLRASGWALATGESATGGLDRGSPHFRAGILGCLSGLGRRLPPIGQSRTTRRRRIADGRARRRLPGGRDRDGTRSGRRCRRRCRDICDRSGRAGAARPATGHHGGRRPHAARRHGPHPRHARRPGKGARLHRHRRAPSGEAGRRRHLVERW